MTSLLACSGQWRDYWMCLFVCHTQCILSPKYNCKEPGDCTANSPYSKERVLLGSKGQPSDYLRKMKPKSCVTFQYWVNSLISARQSSIFYYLRLLLLFVSPKEAQDWDASIFSLLSNEKSCVCVCVCMYYVCACMFSLCQRPQHVCRGQGRLSGRILSFPCMGSKDWALSGWAGDASTGWAILSAPRVCQ